MKGPCYNSDFCPISLCLCSTKSLQKFCQIDFIVGNQNAFIPGRQIDDNVLMARECMEKLMTIKRNEGWAAIKIDMSNAYTV